MEPGGNREKLAQLRASAAGLQAQMERFRVLHEQLNAPGAVSRERARNRLATLPVIEQAKGIIMGQLHCGPDQAFDLLVAASQSRNVKLADLARALVASVQENAGDQAGTSL